MKLQHGMLVAFILAFGMIVQLAAQDLGKIQDEFTQDLLREYQNVKINKIIKTDTGSKKSIVIIYEVSDDDTYSHSVIRDASFTNGVREYFNRQDLEKRLRKALQKNCRDCYPQSDWNLSLAIYYYASNGSIAALLPVFSIAPKHVGEIEIVVKK